MRVIPRDPVLRMLLPVVIIISAKSALGAPKAGDCLKRVRYRDYFLCWHSICDCHLTLTHWFGGESDAGGKFDLNSHTVDVGSAAPFTMTGRRKLQRWWRPGW